MANPQRVIVFLALLLPFLLGVGTAAADDSEEQGNLDALLNGDYAVTTTRNCVESSGGFDPVTFQALALPPPPATLFRRIFASDRGTLHYNGDGTASLVVQTTTIDNNINGVIGVADGFPVNTSTSICTITYTVHDDLSVSESQSCTFQSLSGGVVFTGTSVNPEVRRQITEHGKLLLTSEADPPSIETITVNGVPSSPRQRICTRSGVLSKLPRER